MSRVGGFSAPTSLSTQVSIFQLSLKLSFESQPCTWLVLRRFKAALSVANEEGASSS